MSEQARYTKGPWLRRRPAGAPFASAIGTSADSAAGDVANVIFGLGARTREEAEANAHLIAAAPEMHEVLATAARTFRQYEALHLAKGTEDGRLKAHANAEMAQRCEAVLAKAEGLPTPAEDAGR